MDPMRRTVLVSGPLYLNEHVVAGHARGTVVMAVAQPTGSSS
jgi:hypothetical protein